jgi:hypothetical protein
MQFIRAVMSATRLADVGRSLWRSVTEARPTRLGVAANGFVNVDQNTLGRSSRSALERFPSKHWIQP